MAEGFVPNFRTYKAILNSDDAYRACGAVGSSICQTANASGHGEYTHDTIRGKTRIHTQVKTADRKSYYQERHTRVLAHIANRYR